MAAGCIFVSTSPITGVHSISDQILRVKICTYIGFCVTVGPICYGHRNSDKLSGVASVSVVRLCKPTQHISDRVITDRQTVGCLSLKKLTHDSVIPSAPNTTKHRTPSSASAACCFPPLSPTSRARSKNII